MSVPTDDLEPVEDSLMRCSECNLPYLEERSLNTHRAKVHGILTNE
jgi:hypothetical protein